MAKVHKISEISGFEKFEDKNGTNQTKRCIFAKKKKIWQEVNL
jgi:hypothetical protein